MSTDLESVIRQHISLSSRRNSRGWFSVVCKVCDDHGRKGKRAGFHFEGQRVGYNCFNCGHVAVYDPSEHQGLSKNMQQVMDVFGVPKEEWQKVIFADRQQHFENTPQIAKVDIEPPVITLPDSFYRLTDDPEDEWAQAAIEHLVDSRAMTSRDYPFYLSKKTEAPDGLKWYGRLIIPVYKGNNVIFWQGRDLSGVRTRKYLSPDIPRENVLYGYDRLFEDTDAPLYIVEGFFDAFALKGVAVFGSKITPNQLLWINKSRRPKVVVPDRYGNGIALAEQALKLDWAVATPDIGTCKDISDAVVKYGLLYTLRTVKDTTTTSYEASVKVKMYCQK